MLLSRSGLTATLLLTAGAVLLLCVSSASAGLSTDALGVQKFKAAVGR